MSDDAPPPYPGLPPESNTTTAAPTTNRSLTPENLDSVLADFRTWLTQSVSTSDPAPQPVEETVDLFTLIGQFTALRHEINLLTKASRTTIEQNGETLKRLAQPEKPTVDPDDAIRPFLKVIIDMADALTIAWKQVEKAKNTLGPLFKKLDEMPLLLVAEQVSAEEDAEPVPTKPLRFWARFFGAFQASESSAFVTPNRVIKAAIPDREVAVMTQSVVDRLQPLLAGIADGYAMSLRRVERVLPQYSVTPIESLGLPFDPELMEVVEVVESDDENSGTVVEEVRRGYRWKGKLFRFAQVKVAR